MLYRSKVPTPPILSSLSDPPLTAMSFYRALAADPDLLGIGWDLPDTLKFIKLALYLKPYIASTLRIAYLDTAPFHLPVNVHDFFKLAIGLADEEVKIAWDGFRTAVWESELGCEDDPVTAFSKVSEYAGDFLDFGLARCIGMSPTPQPMNRELQHHSHRCCKPFPTNPFLRRRKLCSQL